MKKIENTDDHLALHNVATIGVSTVLGAAATAITGDLAAGLATAGFLSAVGIGGMKVGPVRRGLNRAALAVVEVRK